MLNQKIQKYVLLCSLAVLLLPITVLAQNVVNIDAPSQVEFSFPDEIVASGDGQVIAAVWNNEPSALFVRIAVRGSGDWVMRQTLSQTSSGNRKASVAISNNGNVIAVGDQNQGKVFVYSRPAEGGMWSLATSITGTAAERFGSRIALNNEGNILAIAAPVEGGLITTNDTRGAVYIYEQADSGETWTTSVTLRPTVSVGKDIVFGLDVALSGDSLTLAVGTEPLRSKNASNPAAVHVFSRAATDDVWSAPDIIASADLNIDGFGTEIALNTDGDVLAVGVSIRNGEQGGVYIFQRDNGGSSWVEQPTITPMGTAAIRFGASIDLNGAGDRLVVGAPVNNGATYIYGFNEFSGNWSVLNIVAGGFFAEQGMQVALNNEYLVTSETDDGTSMRRLRVVRLDSITSDLIISPPDLALMADESGTVNVNLEVAPASMTTIGATVSGAGLTISPKEVSVSDTAPQTFTITAADDIVSGEYIVTFSADGYNSQQLLVTASNTELLGSLGLPDMAEVTEGASAIQVPVTAVGKTIPAMTSATVTIEGQNTEGLSFPGFVDDKILLETLQNDGMSIMAARDNVYTGSRNVTITLDATGYTSATMTLRIIDSPLDDSPQLTFDPPNLLVSRGVPAELNISISPGRTRVLSIAAMAGEDITISPAVLVFGVGDTVKTLTVTANEVAENTYEQYSTSSVSFDFPNSPEVEVVIEGQFNAGESADSNFGRSIAMSGNGQVMAVGTISARGSVDVYTNNGSGYWRYIQTLTASNAETDDQFGSAIAISDDGNTIAIGAPEEDSTETAIITGVVIDDDDEMDDNAGAVYIFTLGTNDLWTQQTYIKAANASANANFGVSLALSDSGDILAVGADGEREVLPMEDTTEARGAVYIFGYNGTSWSQENYLKIRSDLISTEAEFGTNVALSGDGMTLAVGSPRACYAPEDAGLGMYNCGNPSFFIAAGTVHVFTSDLGDWGSSSLPPPVSINNSYATSNNIQNVGSSVALNRDGMTLIVGIPNAAAGGGTPGAVDIFTKRNNVWGHRQRIVPLSHTGAIDIFNNAFGADVTVNSAGTVLAIGLPEHESNGRGIYQSGDFSFANNRDLSDFGAVYMYRLNDDSGMYEHLLSVKPGLRTEADLNYGTAVSLSAGDGGRGSLAIGAAGLFEIIPYNEGIVIIAAPDEFNLDEGSSRTISVNLSQIGDTEVTVDLAVVGEGLEVEPSMLTFSDTAPQNVVVTATDNQDYSDADRTAMVMLSATDYMSETVTVNIIEDDPRELQPIVLTPEPVSSLTLTAYSSTQIEVMVNTEVNLLVETTGSVDLLAGVTSDNAEVLNLKANRLNMIDIFAGFELGDGTVKLTFSGDGLTTEVRTVTVSVMRGSLIINTVDRLTVNGNNPETFDINITGSAIFQTRVNFLLQIEETGGKDLVRVSGESIQNSEGDIFYSIPRFLDEGPSFSSTLERIPGSEGETTIKVTASIPVERFSAAIMEDIQYISVTVNRPAIGLTVTPPSLEINRDADRTLMVRTDLSAGQVPTITVTPSVSDIVQVAHNFVAANGEIELTGLAVGETVLTIEAVADDYVTDMVEVMVQVVDDFRIEVMDTLNVTEDSSATISVSLRELTNPAGVTVDIAIDPTDGLLNVTPSITFTTTAAQTLTVQALDMPGYAEDRSATLTLTATGYPPQTVTVNIMDDDPRPIGLNVPSDDLRLVRFTDTTIPVMVEVGADLLVETGGAVRLSANGEMSTRQSSLANMETTQITIYGVSAGDGTVRFSVSGTDLISASQTVNVRVSTPALEISAVSALAIDLLTLDMEDLEVTVTAETVEEGTSPEIMVSASVPDGSAITVTPSERSDVQVDTVTMFTVNSGANEEDDVTITIMASHDDYVSASTEVTVNVNLRNIDLTVASQLEIVVGTTEQLTIEVSESTNVSITVASDDPNIASVPADLATTGLTLNDESTTIDVTAEGAVGQNTTLTIEASAVGYMDRTETVTVDILDPLRLQVNRNEVPLIEGGNSGISLSVNRIEGVIAVSTNPSREALRIIQPDGPGLTISPENINLSDTNPRIITINSISDGIHTGVTRNEQFMLTADGYEPVTVSVIIAEGDLPLVDFSVNPSPLEIVTGIGMTAPLTIALNEDTAVNITVVSEDPNIARVPTADAAFTLVGSMRALTNMRIIDIIGGGTAGQRTTLTITATAANHETVTKMVSVEILDTLRIIAEPNRFDLAEGTTSTINVNLSRLEEGTEVEVMVSIEPPEATTGLEVIDAMGTPISDPTLRFTITEMQPITVRARNDEVYNGIRTATLMLTAPGYAPQTVTVDIMDDELPPIGLVVDPSDDQDLLRFMNLEIRVTADQASTLTIVTEGAVSLVDPASASPQDLTAGNRVPIEITGSNIGVGTVTFTVSNPGFVDAVETVRVTVSTPTLMFSPDIATNIELVVGDEMDLSVAVAAESGDAMGGVTLTATVIEGTVDTVTVSPLEILNVPLAESRIFTVGSGDNVGDAMIRITASHPDYEDAIAEVSVNVLDVPSIGTDMDTLDVTEGESADILVSLSRIDSGNVTVTVTTEGDVTAPQELTFDSTAGQPLTVEATDVDNQYREARSATVTLTATGYTTRTVRVTIMDDELPPIGLELDPLGDQDLARFMNLEIGVTADQASTLSIVTEGAVSLVDPASASPQDLTAGNRVPIEITGSNIGVGTVTFTVSSPGFADAVETVRVTVRTPMLMFSPAIATNIELVVGEEMDLSVAVAAESGDVSEGVTLTATVITGTVDTVTVSPLEMLNVPLAESRIFTVDGGDNVGDAMIRITASHPDYEDAIANVRVNVLSEFSIETDPDNLNVTEGDSADIQVSLSRIESGNVVVTVTTEGDVTVNPEELTFSSPAGQTLTVGTTEIPGYAEARSATVRLTATGYTTRTVIVSITERELPPIGLELDPSGDQDLLRFMNLEIGVTADQASTLSIVTEGAVSLVDPASASPQDLSANSEVPIEITGSNIGVGTVTFTVSSPGFADAVETVRVTVRTPMLMFSPAIATNIELVVGEEMDLSVAVAAESGDVSEGVTLTATVITGTVDTVTVSPLEMLNVPLAESRIFTVDGGDNVGDAMIRITASHPDYEDAIAEVSVNVLSELSIGTDVDTLNVTEGDSADIQVSLSRIESGNVVVTVTTEGDVTAPQELTFSSPAGQTLTVGTTEIPGYAEARSATVRLTATGYTTRTVRVSITDSELPPIGLELDPSGDQDLLRFMDLEIGVTADQDSTLSIVTEGAVSLVDPASASPQDLSADTEVPIEITGSNIGVGTVTFTVSSPGFADAVETVRVTVRTPMLMFSPAIATNIELVVGEEMDLSVAVAAESGDVSEGVTLTATVTAGTASGVMVDPAELLNVALNAPQTFTVGSGDEVGNAMIRITASHPDYEDAIAEVSVNVLSELSIGTDVDTLNVTEGDSADIQVSLSRIESGNVVVTVTTEGDVTAPQELTFSSPAGQTLTVGTTEIPGYAEARSATVTLSATGYTTRTVRVSITDSELPPIGLVLDPSGDQDLLRFMDLEIGVTADQDSTLSIVTEGGVSVVGAGSRDLSADTPEQVEISGDNIGVSTVTFTVSSPGFADAVETVRVTVRTPMLMFSPAIATNIELVVGEEMDLSVAVAAESGDVSEGVTLTATVTAGTASGVMVDPAELLNVALNAPQTFTVGSGDEVGNAMIRITASHPDYEDAIAEVSVNVLSELSIGTDVDTLNVTEGDSADILVSLSRIESGNVVVTVTTEGDVTAPQELTFSSPAGQTLTVGTTEIPGYAEARSATVTLSATGYTTRTVRVSITDSELPPIGLELDPSGDQDLLRFMDLEIGVTADQDSTLSIVTEGAVSLVDPASASPQDLTANSEVPIEITGSNIGVGTVTFTVSSPGFADAVETVRVTVRTPMLMFSPAIATNIELVVGEEMDLSVAVAAESGDVSEGVTLTATVTAGTASGVMVDPAELLNVALNDPQTFTVGSGDEVGNAMIRITASHPDYEDAIAEVSVNVLSELSIGTDVDTLNVTEGDSADILVSLSRIESGNVVVTVTTEGDVTVNPEELTFSSPAGQTLTVGTTEIPGYAEARSATVTLSATGYTTRTVRVSITDSELPPIGLVVDPSDDQDLARFMNLEIGVTADQDSTLSIVTEGAVSLVDPASASPQDLSANSEVPIQITGSNIGVGTVTFTVSSPGFADAVETVRVTVRTPMLMFSPAIATNIELVVGEEMDLSVAVAAESGDVSEGVTLTATVTAGTASGVMVDPAELLNVALNDPQTFTVGSGDEVGNAMIRIRASHPDYEDAIAEVSVNVLSELSIGTDVDTLNVTEGDSADILVSLSRIESGNVVVTVTTEGDVTVNPEELTFSSPAGQTLTVGTTEIPGYAEARSATVTLSATGYTTRTVRVSITDSELPPIGLVLDPSDDQDLARFMDLEIGVTADQDSTLSIVTEGGVSVVGAGSRDLSADTPEQVEISGDNIGVSTVTFTVSSPGFADAVETVRVTVRTPTLMFSPAIATNIELVVGEEMDLSVAVAAESGDVSEGVTLTATVTAGTASGVMVDPAELLNVALNAPQTFTVGSGDEVGNAMIRITASHPDYEDAIAEVSVNVLSALSIGTDVDTLNVTEGDSADIQVSLSRIESGNVVVTVTTEGDVTAPQELTFSSPAGQTLTVGTTEIPGYAEARSATVTLSATGYTTRTVRVSITDSELPPIGLVLDPSGDQDLLRFMDLEIGVTADQDSTLSIVTEGAVSLVDPASASPQDLSADTEVPIQITGSNIGVGTVTFTVSSPGFADAVETVRVTVRTPTLMFSPAIATNIELVVGEEMDLSVAVAAESGDVSEGVTLTATVTAGTASGVMVDPAELLNVALNDPQTFTVGSGDEVGNAMIRITASHPDYEDAIAEVSVNVLSELSIGTDVDTLNVTEGDSADIQVSLSRIESGNVVVTVTTEGDVTVGVDELTFSSPAGQTLTVGTTEIPGYAEARSATVTLSATGYTTRTVRVSITERELPPIGLELDPSGDQDLARFMDLEIGVTADQASTLSIVTEGAALSLVGSASQDLSANNEVPIEITGSNIGVGTVTFTVSSPGFADAVETVRVTVRTPSLMFSQVSDTIELVAGGTMADLSVEVDAESGDAMGGVTLTATVIARTVDTVTVDPSEMLNVPLNESRMFTVGSGDNVGNAMIRITASHPDYEDAIADVSVNVLSMFRIGTDVDRLNVTEGDRADILVSLSRIESGNVVVTVTTEGDVTAPQELTFSSTAGQTLTVEAIDIDMEYTEDRSATVTLSATGYTTRTVRVTIMDDELPPIGLVVDPSDDQDLVRFTNLEIGVTADQDSTLSIVTEGAVSLVGSASQDLTAGNRVPIEIRGETIGVSTVTFTVSSPGFANAVETVMITVSTPSLIFSQVSDTIELIAGGTMADLSVEVDAESGDAMGGVTLTATVIPGTVDTVTVDPSEMLNVPLGESRMFTVGSGDNVGNAMIRITASHPDYEDAIADVSVNVLSMFRIGTDVDTLSVTEGDSADILVSLSRIESGDVVVTVTTEGDVTAPQELTFSSTAGQTLTVEATDVDNQYREARSATVTLTATGYTARTVRVTIMDNELPPIGLVVDPSDDQDLARFMNLEIGVTADQDSTLSIVTEGAALSLVGSASRDLSANDEVQVEISGDNIGVSTVTFTVSSPGFADAVETVRVTVRTPMLMFSPAIATNIELVVGEEMDLSVAVAAESGDVSEGVTLTATVITGTVDTVTVSPLEMLNVPLAESRIFTVDGGDNVGDAMIRITASHPDYEDAIAEVSVNVLSELSIGTDVDTLNVTEGDSADILVSLSRIESGNVVVTVTTEGDVTAPQELTFSSPAGQTLTVGTTEIPGYAEARSATVTLSATGYTTRTVIVSITERELPPIGLELDPSGDQDLLRFMNLEIGVTADQDSTLSIVTEGAALSLVGSASQDLSANNEVPIEITGSNIGVGTVTFTVSSPGFADAVETVRVTVRTPSLMFSQVSDTIELVAGGTMADLSVEVDAESGDAMGGVTLTATVIAGTVDTVTVDPSEMLNVPLNESRMFTVGSGDNVGNAMIRITASHPDYEDAIADVSVNVLSMFRIGTDVDRLNVTEGDRADILVSLSRIESGNVVVTVTTEGDVTAPQELTFSSTAGQTLTVEAIDIDMEYTEDRSATVTLSATGYTTRTVRVTIMDDELPPIGLVVDPSDDQDLVRFTNLEIGVTADQDSTLSIVTEGAVSLVGSASQDLTAGNRVPIEIRGETIGVSTVTFTVSSPGFANAVETVMITVSTPSLIFSQVSDTIELIAGGTMADLSVEVDAESGDAMGGVTLTATVIPGTVDTVTVDPSEMLNVPLGESRMFTVGSGDNVGNAMIRITASHPDYEDAIADVSVNVLSMFRIGTDVDTLSVTEGDSADILVSLSRIESGDVVVTVTTEGDVTAPQELTFSSTAGQTLTVEATDVDNQYREARSATVTLTATGYTARTVRVTIMDDELPPIGLVVDPSDDQDLARFMNLEIGVTADQDSTLSIVTEGAALSLVGSASRDLSANDEVQVEISGDNIGVSTVTFTVSSPGFADAVETVRVTVRTPMLMFSPAIATNIELVVGEEMDLSVVVAAEAGEISEGVTLTATVITGTVDTVTVSPLEMLNVPLAESRIFTVDGGDNVGDAMIRITASHPDYEDAIAEVRVNVSAAALRFRLKVFLEGAQ